MNTYCATSVEGGIQVDHIFEVPDDEAAARFCTQMGWALLMEYEVVFEPAEALDRVH